MNYPYNDDGMIYDRRLHMYILTENCIRKELGVVMDEYLDSSGDFNPSTLGERIAKRISQHLYRYIYAYTRNKLYIEYLLAKYPPCRDIIRECLLNEVYFNLRNGDFYNSVDSGVPWEMSISPDSRNLLAEPLPNGVRLLYGGVIIPKGDIRYREDY